MHSITPPTGWWRCAPARRTLACTRRWACSASTQKHPSRAREATANISPRWVLHRGLDRRARCYAWCVGHGVARASHHLETGRVVTLGGEVPSSTTLSSLIMTDEIPSSMICTTRTTHERVNLTRPHPPDSLLPPRSAALPLHTGKTFLRGAHCTR